MCGLAGCSGIEERISSAGCEGGYTQTAGIGRGSEVEANPERGGWKEDGVMEKEEGDRGTTTVEWEKDPGCVALGGS